MLFKGTKNPDCPVPESTPFYLFIIIAYASFLSLNPDIISDISISSVFLRTQNRMVYYISETMAACEAQSQ